RITVSLKDDKRRKVSGLCPIIVEPRFAGDGRTLDVAYHPARQSEWFPLPGASTLGDAAAAYFAGTWASLDDHEIETLFSKGKDSLKVISFNANVRTLLDELPKRKRGVWDDLEVDPGRREKKSRGGLKVLPTLGTNLTASTTAETLGMPR